ncbi:hypothetical protein [Paraburkholderia caledonica]|uniref:Transposase n=1 Tax=Paraburkholderia caledonica TaxID=134536 RepID=A0AB73IR37_9BURK|nr:hypothetical protein [Paraburkholderia caledonica]
MTGLHGVTFVDEHAKHRADSGRKYFSRAVVDHDAALHLFFPRVLAENDKQHDRNRNCKKNNAPGKATRRTGQHDLTEPLMLTIFERSRPEQQRALTLLLRRLRLFLGMLSARNG